jgi:4-hydroxybutyryl-CoA synthetase (ADP-forming)
VLETVLAHDTVGSVITMCTPSATLDYDELAKIIVEMSHKHQKTMLASLMGLDEGVNNRQTLAAGGVPYYTYAEGAIKSLDVMQRFAKWISEPAGDIAQYEVNRHVVKEILGSVKRQGRTHLLEGEGQAVLRAYGLPLPASRLATNRNRAVELAAEIGFPVVMKIVSPQIVHKSEAGGVIVNLRTKEEAGIAFDTIMANAKRYNSQAIVDGVLIVEMVSGGKEMIIGAKREPGIGPVLMLGIGGIYVEALKDITFRLAPVTDHDAKSMLASLKTRELLEGVRGEAPSDVGKLAECIQRLSQLVTDFGEIAELDMNPIVVMEQGKGCKVLDIRIGL